MKRITALLLALILTFSTTVGATTIPEGSLEEETTAVATELSSDESEDKVLTVDDFAGTEWYQNGYAAGLYRNKGLNQTVGFIFQNETVSDILKMCDDTILLSNGWNLDEFFDGTVFKGVTKEDLQMFYEEGINDLGDLLGISLYTFEDSYTLTCTASDWCSNFSMDLYEDDHGTLYELGLGEHNVFCINYGKHSPKGTTYNKISLNDMISASQQDVLKKCYLFWVWARNTEYGSLNWGKDTNFPVIENTSSYYLYMQICTWAAMKGCDFLGCVNAVKDAIIQWDSANASWGDGYYNMALNFYNNERYKLYTV
ncbi:MAG: hypothetical protein IJ274_14230, partial [Lachnospiraceae bacterium]|nr:hypothetical protein [Lachnospiraceae bacterium]